MGARELFRLKDGLKLPNRYRVTIGYKELVSYSD